MPTVEKSIEVDAPVDTVYSQLTEYKELPKFMAGVKEVRKIEDKYLHLRAEIAGKELEWNAEITAQIPNEKISWRSRSGALNVGTIRFYPLGADRTRIVLRMRYVTRDFASTVGNFIAVLSARSFGDLQRFKAFIKTHVGSRAWRDTADRDRAE